MSTIVLASSSKYRAALLARLQLPFETADPAIDEAVQKGEAPEDLVRRLAQAKAEAVAARFPRALVIGSDQVAVCDDHILGKPGTEARAREQLAKLSGRRVRFVTGLCLLNATQTRSQLAVVETPVHFRELSEREIADYVMREQPVDCAGAFKSEGLGIALFREIGGPDPNALIGLPLIELCVMLRSEGVNVLG
ncbi:MAG TPA: nucleoside triphosphate pyrophosphatase [Pseudomonadales bacterium]